VFVSNKILLVGSGGSLKDSGLGYTIDNFDGLIARFNGYKTKGYEKDVGSKCDVWIMNSRIYHNTCFFGEFEYATDLKLSEEDIANYGGNLLIAGYWKYWGKSEESGSMEEALEWHDAESIDKTIIKGLFDSLNNYCYCCEREHRRYATTGLESILHYISKGCEVYLVGFDSTNIKYAEGEHSGHYYSQHAFNQTTEWDAFQVPSAVEEQHNPNFESKIIRNLENLKLIKRLD
jgi:hypothetical protein